MAPKQSSLKGAIAAELRSAGQVLQDQSVDVNVDSAMGPMATRYHFETFYHPYVPAFVKALNSGGVDGLLQREIQMNPQGFMPNAPSKPVPGPFNFKETYDPTEVISKNYPVEDVDFGRGAYSLYNWEVFFHVPLLIADRLSKNQHFEEAMRWFHYIFDPTDTSSDPSPKRYWRTKPFYLISDEEYAKQEISRILLLLAKGGDPGQQLSDEEQNDLADLETEVRRWRDDPFKPHLVARLRLTAYQKTVVMKYLDNLIAWGDQLFRRDTIESINEAAQLYILASEILGRRPEDIPSRAVPRVQTYNSLAPKLGKFADALVEIEEFITPSAAPQGGTPGDGLDNQVPLTMTYFCVPQNERLLGYWDTVADRLFKIRHCMNIEGVVRQLPLFEPPIDPALLVKAAAAGLDLGSVMNDLNAPLPCYRFNVLAQKATELCAEVKALGSALIAALEKRDAEGLALLRSGHEMSVLKLVEDVKVREVTEAAQNQAAVRKTRDVSVAKYLHFQKLLGVQSPSIPAEGQRIADAPSSVRTQEEGGVKMTPQEIEEAEQLEKAQTFQLVASVLDCAAGIANIVPNFNIAPMGTGTTMGGSNIGAGLGSQANFNKAVSSHHSYQGSRAAKLGGYALRAHDWALQSTLAAREIMQVDQQIVAADIRLQIAERGLENHRRQMENAAEVDAFMREKYTNQELYGWMIGQVSGVYFQSYQLAYEAARRTERAFRFELGLQESSFIQFGSWDSLHRGLLAGEQLYHDLKRLELAHLDQNKREYEITKHISLLQLDPVALIQLRQTGDCVVRLPEVLFDIDHPGHLLRRLKSVGLTIPCVSGPYASVSCTLTLLKGSIRHRSSPSANGYARRVDEDDARFIDSTGVIASIVTSSAQNDSGMFEPTLRDERYLPFEGAGVISEWRLELARQFRSFDYDTISDVVLHLRYTARNGGEPLRQQAESELLDAINEIPRSESAKGPARLVSLRHEFSSKWYQFLGKPTEAAGDQTITVSLDLLPFMLQGRDASIGLIEAFIKIKPAFADTHNESTIKLTLASGSTAPTSDEHESEDLLELAAWNGQLRATTGSLDAPLGDWTLNAWLDDGADQARIAAEAVEDLVLVCHLKLQ